MSTKMPLFRRKNKVWVI